MPDTPEYLTQEKYDQLVKELEYLKTQRRKEVAENLEYAKSAVGECRWHGKSKWRGQSGVHRPHPPGAVRSLGVDSLPRRHLSRPRLFASRQLRGAIEVSSVHSLKAASEL